MNFLSHTDKKHIANRNWLTRAFPVPNALIIANTSIDISDGTMRFIECSRNKGFLSPKQFGVIPFPQLHTRSFDEKSKKEAGEILENWVRETGNKRLRAIIHEDEAYVFKATVPTTHPLEIRSAIEGLLEENVPIPPSEALFEYTTIACDTTLNESTVAVSVISKKSVENYIQLFAEHDIEIISLDTEARALTKAIFKPEDTDVHVVIAISKKHSTVFIVEKRAVVFSSSVEVGQDDINTSIAKTLTVDIQEAEKLKKEILVSGTKGDVKIFEAMMPVFSVIRDELTKIITYWKTQSKKERDFKNISNIVLLGSDASIEGFLEYIESASKIPTHIGSVWLNTITPNESLPELHKNESLDYGALIGTLL